MTDPQVLEKRINETDFEEIGEFMNEAGAIELLSILDTNGYRLDRLDEKLDVSRSYINKRLAEGRGLNLFTRDVYDGYKVHKLTSLGEIVRDHLRHTGFTQTHEQYRNIRKQFESEKTEIEDWAQNSENIEERFEEELTRLRRQDNADRADF